MSRVADDEIRIVIVARVAIRHIRRGARDKWPTYMVSSTVLHEYQREARVEEPAHEPSNKALGEHLVALLPTRRMSYYCGLAR